MNGYEYVSGKVEFTFVDRDDWGHSFSVDKGTTWNDVLMGDYPEIYCFSNNCYWRVEDQAVLVGGRDGFQSTAAVDWHGADFDVLVDASGNPISRHSEIKNR